MYTTVAGMVASTETTRGLGAIWRAQGFRYIEVASDDATYHLELASGVRVKALGDGHGNIYADQLGWVIGSDITTAFNQQFPNLPTRFNLVLHGMYDLANTSTIAIGANCSISSKVVAGFEFSNQNADINRIGLGDFAELDHITLKLKTAPTSTIDKALVTIASTSAQVVECVLEGDLTGIAMSSADKARVWRCLIKTTNGITTTDCTWSRILQTDFESNAVGLTMDGNENSNCTDCNFENCTTNGAVVTQGQHNTFFMCDFVACDLVLEKNWAGAASLATADMLRAINVKSCGFDSSDLIIRTKWTGDFSVTPPTQEEFDIYSVHDIALDNNIFLGTGTLKLVGSSRVYGSANQFEEGCGFIDCTIGTEQRSFGQHHTSLLDTIYYVDRTTLKTIDGVKNFRIGFGSLRASKAGTNPCLRFDNSEMVVVQSMSTFASDEIAANFVVFEIGDVDTISFTIAGQDDNATAKMSYVGFTSTSTADFVAVTDCHIKGGRHLVDVPSTLGVGVVAVQRNHVTNLTALVKVENTDTTVVCGENFSDGATALAETGVVPDLTDRNNVGFT